MKTQTRSQRRPPPNSRTTNPRPEYSAVQQDAYARWLATRGVLNALHQLLHDYYVVTGDRGMGIEEFAADVFPETRAAEAVGIAPVDESRRSNDGSELQE
jgi:hypothetical protein